jgi:outer membrane receptor protein involved in Fe transport
VTPAGTDTLPYEALFTNPVPGLSPTATSRDYQYGLYIQDDWVQNEHLTWNIGARWDYERNLGFLNYVTPASVVAAYGAQDPNAPAGQTYAQTLANGGVNINDYISNGHNRKAYTGEFQPRLGFSLDINADQQHVIFGGYGRSYDRDLYDYLQVEVTNRHYPNTRCISRTPPPPRRMVALERLALLGIRSTSAVWPTFSRSSRRAPPARKSMPSITI